MDSDRRKKKPRVVIVGAGFGGLEAAGSLRTAPVDVLLIDKNNYHTFQPLLYQVATAGLEPEEIAHAVRGIYHRNRNFDFRMATVTGIDYERKHVLTDDSDAIAYDYLILAAGASTNDFGVEGVREYAFPLKSLTDAMNLRSHIIRQFERVAAGLSVADDGSLSFVVVGGGPTGVETAGALVELIDMVFSRDYRSVDLSKARVYLIEMMSHVLPPFSERLRAYAADTLRKRGVDLRLSTSVIRVAENEVELKGGETIPTRTLIWAAGVKANPLVEVLNLETGPGGRVIVNPDLRVPDHPEVFVIGDLAASFDEDGNVYPQLAPVAMQGARHAARQIVRLESDDPTQKFTYRDKGIMSTIGRNAAVAEIKPGIKSRGFAAWLIWLFLHLMMLVGFRNRMNVFVNWAWNYFTYDRGARMIIDVLPEEFADTERKSLWRQSLKAGSRDSDIVTAESDGDSGGDSRVVLQ